MDSVLPGVPSSSLVSHKVVGAVGPCMEPCGGGIVWGVCVGFNEC